MTTSTDMESKLAAAKADRAAVRTLYNELSGENATLKTVALANQNAALDLTAKLAAAEARIAELENDRREIFALKGAAEAESERLEAVLREIADEPCAARCTIGGRLSVCGDVSRDPDNWCGVCRARAALDGGGE